MIKFKEDCEKIWKKQVAALSIEWDNIQSSSKENDAVTKDDDDDDESDLSDFSDFEDEVGGPASSAAVVSGAGSRKKKKEGEDTKELKSLKTGEFFDSITPNKASLAICHTY